MLLTICIWSLSQSHNVSMRRNNTLFTCTSFYHSYLWGKETRMLCKDQLCVCHPLCYVTSILLKNESKDEMVWIQLKHKLSYKGHYQDMHVDTGKIKTALNYLTINNIWYKDVTINPHWINTLGKLTKYRLKKKLLKLMKRLKFLLIMKLQTSKMMMHQKY